MDEDLIIEACHDYLVGSFATGVIVLSPIAFHNAEGWAREQEDEFTKQLQNAKVGDKFLDFLIIHVDADLLPRNHAIGKLARQMETSDAARPIYRGSDHRRAARA